jgi:RNA polymerase sigma factor (TIGR02999 family)
MADLSITHLLQAAQNGDEAASEGLARIVYHELHRLAQAQLAGERTDHTLQPTALVHEAFLRLVGQQAPWQNRLQFFGVASTTMRRILVDHARRRIAERRDFRQTVELEQVQLSAIDANDERVVDVHEALVQLERLDARQARVVELKFFSGLTIDEIAALLSISSATVSREWTMARKFLRVQLSD